MRRTLAKLGLAFVSAAIVHGAAAAAEGQATLFVQVRDRADTPVTGATVDLLPRRDGEDAAPAGTGATDAEGTAVFVVDPGRYRARVRADGFVERTVFANWSAVGFR